MSENYRPHVKAEVMRWLREVAHGEMGGRRAIPIEDAATRAGVDAERLRKAEDEQTYSSYDFTIAELRRLAEVYGRPVWHFYWPRPPRDEELCNAIASFGDDHGDNSATFWCELALEHGGLHVEAGEQYGMQYAMSWSGNAAEESLKQDLTLDEDVEEDVDGTT